MMKNILILENGKTISNMVNLLSNDNNYEIFLSESHFEMTELDKPFYDLIIADLTSIKNEKVELLMQLKNDVVFSMVPFILITSKNGNEMTGQYSLFNYFLTKPFNKDELAVLINEVLDHTNNVSPW